MGIRPGTGPLAHVEDGSHETSQTLNQCERGGSGRQSLRLPGYRVVQKVKELPTLTTHTKEEKPSSQKLPTDLHMCTHRHMHRK